MTKYRLDLSDVDQRLFFGVGDKHLRALRSSFPDVTLTCRGGDLVLTGEDGQARKAYDAANALLTAYRKQGRLEEWDVADALADRDESGLEIATPRKRVTPRTPNQEKYVRLMKEHSLVFGVGPAGTGKTFLAVAMAIKMQREGKVDRIILTRPAVETGERLGYLPGTFQEKIAPYLAPLFDSLYQLLPADRVRRLSENNRVDVVPLAYMRGRTLLDSFVILDEAQNTTPIQMKMFLTRFGPNSRVVVNGDTTQIDIPNEKECGLLQALSILKGVKGIGFVNLTREDVVRHPLVRDIVEAYAAKG